MRERQLNQVPRLIPCMEHPRAEELQRISDILDETPIISDMVWQYLTCNVQAFGARAHGMSADQVLRAPIVKQTEVSNMKISLFISSTLDVIGTSAGSGLPMRG